MTRSVTFNGQTQFKPGAISKINAQGLVPVGLSTNGIVALLGEADGGTPGEVITIDDPALAKELLRSGDLADAVRLAFDPSNDPRIPGGAFRVLAYKVNQSTQASVQLPGDDSFLSDTVSGASTTAITLTTNTTMVVNAHVGRWLEISGERRQIVSNTADTLTVSPGFSSAPLAATAIDILQSQLVLTSVDYGDHTNQIAAEFEPGVTANTWVFTGSLENLVEQTGEILGNAAFRIKYVGGPQDETGSVNTITAGVPFDATGATFQFTPDGGAPTLDEWAGMMFRFSNGIQRLITGNTAATPSVITLSAGHELSTDEQSEVDDDSGAAVINVTAATVTITGANGVATGLSSGVLPTADDLNITFSTNQTLRSLIDQINATTNYEAVAADGVNLDTTLMKYMDFGTRATAVDVRFDDQIEPNDKGSFRKDLQDLVDLINRQSTLFTAAKATTGTTEGSELPQATGGVSGTVADVPVYLSGGTRGTSANSNWQDGFDELLLHRVNHVVPLIAEDLTNQGYGSTATWSSVAAQLSSHVDTANSSGKNERGGYIGFKGTKAEFITEAARFNNADVQLCSERHTVLDVDGNLVEQDEWAAAVLAAGMRGGAPEVGEPITFKYIKTFGVDRDASWDPKSITDVNQLLAGGCLFSEPGPNGGFRWVRDITTYLIDENIAYMDGNTRDAVRYIAYELRTDLENQFTGLKATPATAANIRERVAAKLQAFRGDSIIVDSLDPENPNDTATVIPGWRRLRVSITGNVATVKVEVFPVTGIVFELLEIFLQLPRIAA